MHMVAPVVFRDFRRDFAPASLPPSPTSASEPVSTDPSPAKNVNILGFSTFSNLQTVKNVNCHSFPRFFFKKK